MFTIYEQDLAPTWVLVGVLLWITCCNFSSFRGEGNTEGDGKAPPTIAHMLRTKAQRKTSVFFNILWHQHKQKKQNWQSIFSRFLWWNPVKFGRLLVNILLKSCSVSKKSMRPVFFPAVKDKNLHKSKKKTLLFLCFSVKILEDFTRGNSGKSPMP